jgi:HlyD family secretion protein
MIIKKIVSYLFITSIVIGTCYVAYKKIIEEKPISPLFKVERPQKRTIKRTVSTSGVLELKNVLKVGSFQIGIVKDIYVQENERVKKGQLIAFIDTGKNRTEVEAAEHRVEKAKKEYEYQLLYFQRQEALYNAGQLSKDNYQKIKKEYEKSLEDVKVEEALLRKSTLDYESTKIKAPEDGVVIAVHATKGMVVSDVSNTILFEIAKDITCMRASLDIDESEVGHVKKGLKVNLIPNSFPEMKIKSTVSEISFVPKGNATQSNASADATLAYKAKVDVNNSNLCLRPGMIVNATIKIQKAKDVISIPGLAFYISSETIKKIAQKINFTCVELEKEKKQSLKSDENKIIKFVWIADGKNFIQKAATVGLTDNMYWEIKDGIAETDNVITDVEEPSEMDELYQKWFRGSL